MNLFIASELKWRERGLTLRQETRFPDEDRTRLGCASDADTRLRLRHPVWAGDGSR